MRWSATTSEAEPRLTPSEVTRRWWPLAASWLLMTGELVIAAAVVARLPDPDVQLAAWGVVFAIITVIQAPSNAFLPVSTALSTDRWSFRRLGRYVLVVLATLTTLHVLLAATPLYDVVLGTGLGLPTEVLEAARWPLIAMILWSPGTGYRRYLHGALIRVGFSRVTIWGAGIRLGVGITVLAVGAATLPLPGALLAACGIIAGVVSETVFVRWRAAVLLPQRLPPGGSAAGAGGERLGVRRFADFYTPLVLTALLTMGVQIVVTGFIGRMPQALASLAVWPVVSSFLILWQAPAFAYTEVVISVQGRLGAATALWRVTWWSVALLTVGLGLAVATPLAAAWFDGVMGLSPVLTEMALLTAVWLMAVPALRMLHSHLQGVLVATARTRAVFESVVVFLLVVVAVLSGGVVVGTTAGAYVGALATTLGLVAQTAWLAARAAGLRRQG
jgi:hypothetical protein